MSIKMSKMETSMENLSHEQTENYSTSVKEFLRNGTT